MLETSLPGVKLTNRGNSPESFYGHILFTNDQASIQCLQAERTPVNGSLIKTATCEYDYDSAGASDQYFQ